METNISLEGLLTVGGDEERALADVRVTIDDKTYDWKIFIPPNVDLSAYLNECKDFVVDDILSKESQWETLTPKTKEYTDPFTQEVTIVDIAKEEIVKPTIPDYYALRRSEYPPLGEQLGAIWKGVNSEEYIQMMQKIQLVKDKYPKS